MTARRRPTRVIGAVLALVLAACGSSTSETDSESTVPRDTDVEAGPSTTSSPATTDPPPLVAVTIGAWDDKQVSTVCYEEEQSFPQVAGYGYDLRSVVRDMLGAVGVIVQPDGMPCDAVLDVALHLEGRPAVYEGAGTIYSGMLRRLDMSLLVVTSEPLEWHHLTDEPPGELAASDGPATPEEFLTEYEDVWPRLVLGGLVEFWGPAVAIEQLRDDTHDSAPYALLCDLSGAAPGECPPMDYATWRTWFEQDGSSTNVPTTVAASIQPPRYIVALSDAVPGERSRLECCTSDPPRAGDERTWSWALDGDPRAGLVVGRQIFDRPGASPEGDYSTSTLAVDDGRAWLAIPNGPDGKPAGHGFTVFWSRSNDDVWLFQSFGITAAELTELATDAFDQGGELTLADPSWALLASGDADGGEVLGQVFVIDTYALVVTVGDVGAAFDSIVSANDIGTVTVAGATGYSARHTNGQVDVVWHAAGEWWATLTIHAGLEVRAPEIIAAIEQRPSSWTEPPLDPEVDLLAHWPAAPVSTTSLADVPTMLPDRLPTDGTVVRRERAGGAELAAYVQIWADDEHDRVLAIRTDVPGVATTDGSPVDVPPWDLALLHATGPDVATMTLVDPSGSVRLWARGYPDALVEIAASLRLRGYAGWAVDAVRTHATLLSEGWQTGIASRSVSWPGSELNIATGTREWLLPPWGLSEFDLVEVNGSPAVAVEDGSGRSAVTWTVNADVTVQLGHVGPLAEALEIARSVHWVDESTWQGASRLDTGDGCSSMFC